MTFVQLNAIVSVGSRNPAAKIMYDDIDGKMERITKLAHLVVLKIEAPFTLIVPVIISYWDYFTSEHSKEAFLQYYPASWASLFLFSHNFLIKCCFYQIIINSHRFPFDCKTPIGYGVSALFQAFASIFAGLLLVHSLVLTIGLCTFVIKLISDLKTDVQVLDTKVRIVSKEKIAEQIDIRNKLIEIVKFHSESRW